MSKNLKPIDWKNSFQKFLSAEEASPSSQLSAKILESVFRDLNPHPSKVFSKMALIHLVFGTLTLIFCPQFGISLSQGMGLMALLMHFGPHACMLGCGAVFLGGSTLMAALTLKPEEIRVIKRTKVLQIFILTTLSLGALLCLGGDVITTLGLFWAFGSLVGGMASLEVGWRLRAWLKRHSYSTI